MTERTFKTTLIWHDGTGMEHDCEASVTYVGRKGFAGDGINPPEDASVEIIKIEARDQGIVNIPERFLEDDDLMAECFEDWAADEARAEEYRADAARDDRMVERF